MYIGIGQSLTLIPHPLSLIRSIRGHGPLCPLKIRYASAYLVLSDIQNLPEGYTETGTRSRSNQLRNERLNNANNLMQGWMNVMHRRMRRGARGALCPPKFCQCKNSGKHREKFGQDSGIIRANIRAAFLCLLACQNNVVGNFMSLYVPLCQIADTGIEDRNFGAHEKSARVPLPPPPLISKCVCPPPPPQLNRSGTPMILGLACQACILQNPSKQ